MTVRPGRRQLTAFLAGAALALAAGCSGAEEQVRGPATSAATDAGAALPAPRARAVPPLRTVQVEGTSLSLPADWVATTSPSAPEAAFTSALARVRQERPTALGQIEESLSRPSAQRLVAFDPRPDGPYMARVRLGIVPRQQGFEGSFAEWSGRWRDLTRSTPTLFGRFDAERVTLPAGGAFRISYRYRSYDDIPLVADDYYVVKGDRVYVLAFEGPDEGLLPVFRAIAATFSLHTVS